MLAVREGQTGLQEVAGASALAEKEAFEAFARLPSVLGLFVMHVCRSAHVQTPQPERLRWEPGRESRSLFLVTSSFIYRRKGIAVAAQPSPILMLQIS